MRGFRKAAAFAALLLAPGLLLADEPDAASEARALLASGSAALREGRHAVAARDFAAAAALRPPDGLEADARLLQAKSLTALARFEDAVVVLDAFLKLAPNAPETFEALVLRGEALVAASALTPHFQEAAVSFSMALETDGTSSDSRARAALRLADALLRMDDAAGAAKTVARLSHHERDILATLAAQESNPRLARIVR